MVFVNNLDRDMSLAMPSCLDDPSDLVRTSGCLTLLATLCDQAESLQELVFEVVHQLTSVPYTRNKLPEREHMAPFKSWIKYSFSKNRRLKFFNILTSVDRIIEPSSDINEAGSSSSLIDDTTRLLEREITSVSHVEVMGRSLAKSFQVADPDDSGKFGLKVLSYSDPQETDEKEAEAGQSTFRPMRNLEQLLKFLHRRLADVKYVWPESDSDVEV
ncbi:hypothetical protein Rs2_41734 [Raphanus sativus]|nr:hypothetical protein Rs2_41734 [Raphanus sativus]